MMESLTHLAGVWRLVLRFLDSSDSEQLTLLNKHFSKAIRSNQLSILMRLDYKGWTVKHVNLLGKFPALQRLKVLGTSPFGAPNCDNLEDIVQDHEAYLTSLKNTNADKGLEFDCTVLTNNSLDKTLKFLEIGSVAQVKRFNSLNKLFRLETICITPYHLEDPEIDLFFRLPNVYVDEAIQWPSHIKHVRASPPEVCSFNGCEKLESLELSFVNSTKFDNLFLPESLTKLNLVNCQTLRSLAAISTCQQLKRLDASKCRGLEDITGVSSCKSLQWVSFRDCDNLVDVSPLGVCSMLEFLNILGTSVGDVNPLRVCRNLHGINTSANDLTQLSRECPLLTGIVWEPGVGANSRLAESISGLCIETLEIFWSEDQSTDVLRKFTNLRELNATRLPDVFFLSSCILLTKLELRNCVGILKNLAVLKKTPSLAHLSLSHMCELKSIQGIEFCEILKYLHISECYPLRDVTRLSNLRYLETLDIEQENKIFKKPLQCSKTLQHVLVTGIIPMGLSVQKLNTFTGPTKTFCNLIAFQAGNVPFSTLDPEESCRIKNSLRSLRNLTVFDLECGSTVFDHEYVQHITFPDTLREQSVDGKGRSFVSYDWLKYCTSLEKIDFSMTSSLSPQSLENCIMLEILHLEQIQVSSLNLSRCLRLQELRISTSSHLEEFNVTGCSSLRALDVSSYALKEIMGLEDCVKLTRFETAAWGMSISPNFCFSSMRNCINLCTLKMSFFSDSGVGSSDFSWIVGCTHLVDLTWMGDSKLKNIDGLQHLRGLSTVRLCTCSSIEDITALGNLAQLAYLDLSDCLSVKDITPLGRCSFLTEIYLDSCGGGINATEEVNGADALRDMNWGTDEVRAACRRRLAILRRVRKVSAAKQDQKNRPVVGIRSSSTSNTERVQNVSSRENNTRWRFAKIRNIFGWFTKH